MRPRRGGARRRPRSPTVSRIAIAPITATEPVACPSGSTSRTAKWRCLRPGLARSKPFLSAWTSTISATRTPATSSTSIHRLRLAEPEGGEQRRREKAVEAPEPRERPGDPLRPAGHARCHPDRDASVEPSPAPPPVTATDSQTKTPIAATRTAALGRRVFTSAQPGSARRSYVAGSARASGKGGTRGKPAVPPVKRRGTS